MYETRSEHAHGKVVSCHLNYCRYCRVLDLKSNYGTSCSLMVTEILHIPERVRSIDVSTTGQSRTLDFSVEEERDFHSLFLIGVFLSFSTVTTNSGFIVHRCEASSAFKKDPEVSFIAKSSFGDADWA